MMAFTGYYESIMTMGGMSTDAVTQALFFLSLIHIYGRDYAGISELSV